MKHVERLVKTWVSELVMILSAIIPQKVALLLQINPQILPERFTLAMVQPKTTLKQLYLTTNFGLSAMIA